MQHHHTESDNRSNQYIRLKAVAEQYPISEAKLRKLVLQRAIPYYKVGRLVYFAETDVAALFEAGRVAPRRNASE